MRTSRWNAKRLAAAAAVLLCLYVVFSAGRKTYESEVLVLRTRPEAVWDFVADFTNMRLLNPTILSFTITGDSGNMHHWRYGVEYVERLSHWPYWLNRSHAYISVKRIVSETGPEQFAIESEHQTCFLRGLYCLNSVGTFTFVAHGPDTLCREVISYQCPPFLSNYCRGEVEFQRNAIMRNLAAHFAGKSSAL